MSKSTEPRLSLKATVTLIAAAVTSVLGVAVIAAHLTVWIAAPAAFVLVAAGGRVARFLLLNTDAFSRYTPPAQDTIIGWMTVAGLLHATWLSLLAWFDGTFLVIAAFPGLIVLGVIEYAVASFLDWLWRQEAKRLERERKAREAEEQARRQLAERQAAEEAARKAAEAAKQEEQDEKLLPQVIEKKALAALDRTHEDADFDYLGAYVLMRKTLKQAGFGYIDIKDIRPNREGGGSVTYEVQVPSKALARLKIENEAVANGQKIGKDALPSFDSGASGPLAIALGEVSDGKKVPKGALRVLETRWEGVYEVVLLLDRMNGERRVLVYEDDVRWRSLDELCCLGNLTSGGRALVDLRGHVQVIAQSEGGKTNVLNLILAYLMCTHSVLWIGGARKQYESWGILLDRYFGKDVRIPIDWLAQGVLHTIDQLLAALAVMNYRQTVPLSQRDELPALFLLIDEASEIFRNTRAKVLYRGEWCTASELLEKLYQGSKSAKIYTILAVHRDADQLGDRGASINSGVDLKIILRTDDTDSYGRMTGKYKLQPLEHPGEVYLHPTGSAPVHATCEYMQEPLSKPKALRTNGITLMDVGWARRHLVGRRQFDKGSRLAAEKATQLYAARHLYFNDEMMKYLTSDPDSAQPTPAAPQADSAVDAPTAALNARLERMLAAHSDHKPATDGAASEPATTPTTATAATIVLERKKTRRERILELVAAHGPIGSTDLGNLLRHEGYDMKSRTGFLNELQRLTDDGRLAKDETTKTYTVPTASNAA